MPLVVESFGLTDVGLQRKRNEDAFKLLSDNELFVLADGMGGHASGEVASRLAVDHAVEFLLRDCRAEGFTWPYPGPAEWSYAQSALSNAIQFANERVFIESMKDRRYDGMGTTMAAILGSGPDMVLGHVGDSRIYRIRGGRIEQMSEDHSLLNHYLRQNRLTPEEARNFKGKNVIVKAVGLRESVQPDIRLEKKVAGDVYLLCSDGLSDLVDDWVMAQVVSGLKESLPETAEALIRLANQAGGKDNITVLLVHVVDDSVPETAPTEPDLDIRKQLQVCETAEIPVSEAQEDTEPAVPTALAGGAKSNRS